MENSRENTKAHAGAYERRGKARKKEVNTQSQVRQDFICILSALILFVQNGSHLTLVLKGHWLGVDSIGALALEEFEQSRRTKDTERGYNLGHREEWSDTLLKCLMWELRELEE